MDDKTMSSPDVAVAEYKFAESDGVPPEGGAVDQQSVAVDSGSATTSSDKSNIKRKLVIPGVIVLAILFVYAIFSFYGARKSRLEEQKKVKAQEVIAMQQATIPVPPATKIGSEPAPTIVQPSQVLSSDQIAQIQNAVQQKLDEVNQGGSDKQNQILGLQDAITKSQQDVADINKTVNQLTVVMQQVLKEIQALKTPKVKPKKKISKPLEVYHVRAIVPGRVWLESANGKSVTLRVGDPLEGYGTVEVISPRQGMVIMSNGSYIQYGVNDF